MPHIRPIAIALIIREGYILVAQSTGRVDGVVFYRPPGGGIEYGEYAEVALRRELCEELDAELLNVRYLGTIENIFTIGGNVGHELVRLYTAELADPALYDFSLYQRILDGAPGDDETICWQPLTRFRAGDAPLYPDGLLEYLDQHGLA